MIQIQHRRGTAQEWHNVNPILAEGELGVETDTLKVKLGNGTTDWNHLSYFTQGVAGPANSISIGTVTSGATPSATMTGTAPLQTLNLVLEKGDAATITVGTTTNKLPGTTAEVINTGDNKNAVFDFKIPRGTTVAVGTTTTGDTDTMAAVTNSGTASDLVLDFAIPRGAGVPTGGTAGQILAKSSSTNFDTVWMENYADFTSTVKHNVRAGETLAIGTPVYVTGYTAGNMVVSKASNASEATSSKVMGLTAQALANNAIGYVIAEGLVQNVNTSTATIGDPVWLGAAGALLFGVANKPVAPAHLVFIGIVTKVGTTTGEIWCKVQNGFELGELHDVLITSPSNGQSLTYDSATGLWKNSTPASNLDSLTDVTLSSPTDKQVLQYEASSGQWKNKAATGGVTTGATPPATPMPGDAWYDTTDGLLYVYYNDGNSSQWVEVKANSALEANLTPRIATVESRATTLESGATRTVSSASARDLLFPTPVQGNTVWRSDKGWEERYFALYNSSSNVGGATPAGWYPVSGALPTARLTKSGNQSTSGTSNTQTILTWDVTSIDVGGMSGVNSYSLTAPISGVYTVNARACFAYTTSGTFSGIYLRKNGVSLGDSYFEDGVPTNGACYPYSDVSSQVSLEAGDYVSVYIGSTNGTSIPLAQQRCFFELTYFGPKR